jgi:hypothetical protein
MSCAARRDFLTSPFNPTKNTSPILTTLSRLVLMKVHTLIFLAAMGVTTPCSLLAETRNPMAEGMTEGEVKLKTVSQIAFGPEGVLFIADPLAASIYAVATGDRAPGKSGKLKLEAFDEKLAAMLGTTAGEILIHDLAVNPISKNIYVAVSRGRGPAAIPVLARVTTQGVIEPVGLDKVLFAKAELPNPPNEGAPGGRGNPRLEAITDLAFFQDRLLIAGLSNEEFASTFRAIPFPFKKVPDGTSVEIYHGAHGKFETRSPVRTFIPFMVGEDPVLLAAYTCTPLVQIPMSDLKPGAKIKGKTIAELGNRNRPLDMITYQKGGKDFVLMANSARGIMKIATDNIENAEGIESKVEGGKAVGQPYESIAAWKGVTQLDKLDDANAIVLHTPDGKAAALEALPLP